jgi:hypothetical protein
MDNDFFILTIRTVWSEIFEEASFSERSEVSQDLNIPSEAKKKRIVE